MKKIIGIIAAVAMAASVFALNDATGITASVNIGAANSWETPDASLINFDGSDFNMLDITRGHSGLSLSIDLGVVGASMDCDKNGNIWFKPFGLGDMLKITLGGSLGGDYGLCGTADFYVPGAKTLAKDSEKGYKAESKLLDGKLSLNLILNTKTDADKGYWSVNGYSTNFQAAYEDADSIGKIAAYFSAAKTFETLRFGLGWTRGFGDDDLKITPIFNVIGDYDDGEFQTLKLEPSLTFGLGAVTLAAYVPVEFNFRLMDLFSTYAKEDYKPYIGASVKADFKIAEDGYLTNAHVYAGVGGYEITVPAPIGKKFRPGLLYADECFDMKIEAGVDGKIETLSWFLKAAPTMVFIPAGTNDVKVNITAGISGNYGGMEWRLWAIFDIADKFTVDVPFSVKVTF